MRILFADQFSEPGGAQLCLRDVIEESRARGWMCNLLTPGSGLPASIASYSNGEKTPHDALSFAADTLRAGQAIRRAVHKDRIDLVYANGPRILAAAAMASCPLVFHAHSYLAAPYARTIARLCLRGKRAAVFAASRFVAAPLIQMSCAPNIQVVYNGVADQQFAARSFSAPALTIGIAGRISPEKGHLDFVRAAREIARSFPATQFVVYGAPLFSGDRYEREVRSAGSGLNIEFCGWTSDFAEALHRIDILAVPSAPIESTPRVILEALSAGTPVLAYPSGGIPELIRPHQTGILTAEPSAGALAGAILELMTNRAPMRWIAVNGRREWQRRFTLERFTHEICDSLAAIAETSIRAHALGRIMTASWL